MSDTPKTLEEAYKTMMSEMGKGSEQATPPAEVTPPMTETAENTPPAQETPAENVAENATQPNNESRDEDVYNVLSQQTAALRNATGMIQQMQNQNRNMSEENERLRKALNEQNQAAETAETRAATTPPAPPQIPSFDELAYLSDTEKAAKQNEYMQKMAEFIKGQAMADIQPFLDRAKEAERHEAEEAIIQKLSNPQSGYADFADYLPMIRNIAKNNPLVANAELGDDKFLTAYAIAKGIKANEPKPAKLKLTDEDKRLLSNEELLEIYRGNRDLQKLIAQEQIGTVRETESIPPFSASGDAANVALNVQDKPKNFEDARKGMMQKIMALRGGIK